MSECLDALTLSEYLIVSEYLNISGYLWLSRLSSLSGCVDVLTDCLWPRLSLPVWLHWLPWLSWLPWHSWLSLSFLIFWMSEFPDCPTFPALSVCVMTTPPDLKHDFPPCLDSIMLAYRFCFCRSRSSQHVDAMGQGAKRLDVSTKRALLQDLIQASS